MRESSSCSREDALDDCGRPCDHLSCLFFTALWLRCSQSIVVQETSSAKDVDLTCSITFLFGDATCHPVGPMSLDWPVHPFGRSESSVPLLPPDAPSDGLRRVALLASERSRWRQGTLQAQPQILQRIVGWDGCGPFLSEGLRCIIWNTRVLLDLFSPDKGTGNLNSITSKNSWTITTTFASRKYMEKDEVLQAIQVLGPRFRLFGTFLPDKEKAGGSAICIHRDLLPE